MRERVTRICDIAKVVAGGTPRRGVDCYYGGAIPWVKTLDLNCGVVEKTEESITEEGLRDIRGDLNPPGTIMVAMYGGAGTIGKSGLLHIHAATNQAVASIIPNPDCFDSDFLHYQLMFLRNEWMRFSQGNRKDPNINKSVIEKMLVWLPEKLAEQRKIAARLKALLAEVDKARQAAEIQRQEIINLADAIIFNSIRSGKTKTYGLGGVLKEIKQGIGENWADYPVLGATRDGLAPAKEPPGKKPERYKPVFPGTVFYNPMRILIGSIALVDDDDTPGITSPDYVALKGKNGQVDSRWFYFWLRSPLGQKCILSLARGAVRERMLFNRLAKGGIELPDFAEQQKASTALAALKPLRQAIEAKLNDIQLLPRKILAQAFGDIQP